MAIEAPSVRLTRFRYRAAADDGRIRRGHVFASSERDVARRLADQGLTTVSVEAGRLVMPRGRVTTRDLAIIFRNVSTLVAAGLPIERAIAVSEGLVPSRVANALTEVRRLIREGESIADALGSVPDVFPPSIVGVLRAGEQGSTLAGACNNVAGQLEAEAELRAEIGAALAYPILILVMGVATVGVMAGVVIPRFAVILTELGAELPASTRALLATSDGLRRLGPLLIVVSFAAVPGVHGLLQRPHLRAKLDRTLLRLPVVGGLRLTIASARLCRALGAMLSSGMPLLSALDSASDASGDGEVTARLARARTRVAQGTPLLEALTLERVLTPTALQLVGVGESSGQLGAMLARAGDLAAEQSERGLRTVVGLLEPLLVIALGVLIAGTAAALLQAVYSVRPT